MKLAVAHVKLAVGNTSLAASPCKEITGSEANLAANELVPFTSSTNRITGSLSADGVLKSLSKRLEACSGVAFCPVSSYRQYKNDQLNTILLFINLKSRSLTFADFFFTTREESSHA